MRSGLSTILQTLTPEAATVLNHSIAEAGRRNHNQTTPLHVAATLLAAPTGFLRQACIRSHPNSSHPLQCRALELCFSVALERLPAIATSSPAAAEPPVSNALMAALKRAQAHQRRGCPEQQQQPLLAVKVELEHLIISILDDPSVSRVMREASFSSPAVKATIEQSLHNNAGFRPSPSPANQVPIPINRNLYVNQRLLQQKQGNLNLIEDVRRVIEIMSRSKKKNPILVGESEPESIKKEILMSIQKGEQEEFENVEVISIEFPPKINELVDAIDTRNRNVVINLGDLKWLIEQPESVADMAKLVTKFGVDNRNVWLIGSATWETYLRCQVYHPSMENDWDLQALPISSRSPLSTRFGTNGIFGSSVECLNSFTNSARIPPCCPKCFHEYELELARSNELEKSSTEGQRNLPQWLRDAKAQSGETETETESDTKMPHRLWVNDHELQKKWSDICLKIHLNYHNQTPSFARMMTGFAPIVHTVMPHKLNQLLSPSQTSQQPEAPRSPVRTELVLGPKEETPVKDLLGCISSEPQPKGKFVNLPDSDTFKKLLKGLMKKAWWQPEAASTIATTLAQSGSKGSMWLLFAGPDRVAKKKMASVLADHFCGGDPITICLGSRRDEDETDAGFRGKTVLDRIAEVVRKNPFSVILLLDVDEADMLFRGSIKRAMERGRLTDSYGREISLGNIIFVLTGNWSTNHDGEIFDEKRLHSVATGGSQLKLSVCEKRFKRKPNWLPEGNMSTKQQKKVALDLSLDLNLGMDVEEDRTDTSDLTIEQGDENQLFASTSISVPHEFVGSSDGLVVFKPVQFELIRREIEKTVKNTFSTIVGEKLSIEVNEQIVDDVLNGLWFGRTGLEDWADQVLAPSFNKLVGQLPSSLEGLVVCLEYDRDLEANHSRDRLPSKLNVKIDAF